jgi:hypothetical protein
MRKVVTKQLDSSILEMALVGYEAELLKIESAIEDIQRELGGRTQHVASVDGAKPAKRMMSAAARQRIADAQKKRWAKVHAQQKAATTKAAVNLAPAKKSKLSPARKAALLANLAKARAAKAAKAKAAA